MHPVAALKGEKETPGAVMPDSTKHEVPTLQIPVDPDPLQHGILPLGTQGHRIEGLNSAISFKNNLSGANVVRDLENSLRE